MTGVSRQKQKLLTMKKLFETKTDEKHTITGNRLIEILGDYGIKAERKTIYDDIKTLCDSGMDIEITKDGHSNAYYLAQRLFQDEELYVLADAVASSRFLTQKKSKELLKKIQSLTSEHKAKDLRRMVYVSNRTKTFNEQIYYAINSIQEGIFSGLEIHFKYYEYTVEKRKQLRHGGEVYTVSPYSLVWENDNYYLVCYCEKHEKICRYRVDRMTQVTVTDIPRRELSEEEKLVVSRARKVQRFLSQPFHVAEQFTGLPGKYVPVSETIRGFQEILDGKHDSIPENYFLNAGSIDDVVERAASASK